MCYNLSGGSIKVNLSFLFFYIRRIGLLYLRHLKSDVKVCGICVELTRTQGHGTLAQIPLLPTPCLPSLLWNTVPEFSNYIVPKVYFHSGFLLVGSFSIFYFKTFYTLYFRLVPCYWHIVGFFKNLVWQSFLFNQSILFTFNIIMDIFEFKSIIYYFLFLYPFSCFFFLVLFLFDHFFLWHLSFYFPSLVC